MIPAEAIASLDAQLAEHGQVVSFRRGAGAQHNARGFVRGYKPEQVVGLISELDLSVVLSPSSLGAYGIPKAGDSASTAGQGGVVQPGVQPVHMNGELVRINLRIRVA